MPVGEFDLIDRFFSGLTPADTSLRLGIGDDAAILKPPSGEDLLVAVDTLVAGVHFFADVEPSALAYKSLAVNISDIAAMGGTPRWATLALTLEDVDENWLAAFSSGFAEAAEEFDIQLVGGDTTRGPLAISVQIMGSVEAGQALLRSGAASGDLVYVSGYPGSAGLALKKLCAGEKLSAESDSSQRLLRPRPRVELGRQLYNLATACIDVSDGLAADLAHILKASAAAAEIELNSLPTNDELQAIKDTMDRYALILGAGDDYELCFTLPAARRDEFEQAARRFDFPITEIGRIVEGEGIRWLDETGKALPLKFEGWQHF